MPPPSSSIDVGQYAPDELAGSSSFAVRGEGERLRFDSTAIDGDAVYGHAFGTPGTYRWTDANGREIGGEIRVGSLDVNDRDACDRWMKALQKGESITIEGARARPESVEILAGQTVFWAVVKSAGITITDETLVEASASPVG